MALLSSRSEYQIRQSNKEPDWSSICNNVFDQYLDTDELFGFEGDGRERSSSNDSANLFDFSGASEQSHQTEATSPIPSWDHTVQGVTMKAKEPRAKEPENFWANTLRALERNAAKCEEKQRTLRSTKSHPDFLSLGGCPSPPAVPSSPTDQSFSAQRRVSRSTANGKRRNVTARSFSRGRPSGVTKTAVGGSANPYGTVRKCSASPSKMMNPSRYRAGFRDVWVDKSQTSPKKYSLRVPSSGLPVSPPPSARVRHDDEYAAFGSPNIYPPLPGYDDQMSPLTNTFQQAHIHTPLLSPAINSVAHANNSYFEPLPLALPNPYYSQTIPLNDAAHSYPERTSSLAANRIQTFDFGFSSSPTADNWSCAPFTETTTAHYTTDQFVAPDPFGSLHNVILPSIEAVDIATTGLGISCDPSLISDYNTFSDTTTLPATTYHSSRVAIDTCPISPPPHGLPDIQAHGLPCTPHRRGKSCHRSQSPSPPATESRSRRASSSRRTSRHRRTKSTNSTPRHSQNLEKGGFVNFTPHDSNKILSGVAPSGSSKTKARREQEAADKRRRLSQAAVKAVVEAGGDLDALSKAGLLIEP